MEIPLEMFKEVGEGGDWSGSDFTRGVGSRRDFIFSKSMPVVDLPQVRTRVLVQQTRVQWEPGLEAA